MSRPSEVWMVGQKGCASSKGLIRVSGEHEKKLGSHSSVFFQNKTRFETRLVTSPAPETNGSKNNKTLCCVYNF